MVFKRWRKDVLKRSQREVAGMLGVSYQTVSNIEKGSGISPRLAVRIHVLSGGKVEVLSLILPDYESVLEEEKARVLALQDVFKDVLEVSFG